MTAGPGVTEGGSATFTISASPAPSAPLSVTVTVTQQGDYGASTGTKTVTVPTSGTKTYTVATTGDNTDEAHGSVTVTLNAGSGYTVSSSRGAATVAVSDDDDPPRPPPPRLPPPPDLPAITIDDRYADAHEDTGAITFVVVLSEPSTGTVTVDYRTREGTAYEYLDYPAARGRLTFRAGTTRRSIDVVPRADRNREPDETLQLVLSNPVGATIAQATATGTIINDD